MATAHERLIHALIAYDEKQSTKRGYNPHALPLYFEALENAENDAAILNSDTPFAWSARMEVALKKFFCDRVLAVVLKALNS